MAKPKVSLKGGRCFAMSEMEKNKPAPVMHLSKRSVKRRAAAQAKAEAFVPSNVPKVLGRRTSRADALLIADQKRKSLLSGEASTKEEKRLQIFCNGRTSGKQKVKGGTKDPVGFPEKSQCAPDVFYADSNKKFGVEKYIDPLKTANVK